MKYVGTPIGKGIGVLKGKYSYYFNAEDVASIFQYENVDSLLSIIPSEYKRDKYDINIDQGYYLLTLEGLYLAAENSQDIQAKNMINDFIEFMKIELEKKDQNLDVEF